MISYSIELITAMNFNFNSFNAQLMLINNVSEYNPDGKIGRFFMLFESGYLSACKEMISIDGSLSVSIKSDLGMRCYGKESSEIS